MWICYFKMSLLRFRKHVDRGFLCDSSLTVSRSVVCNVKVFINAQDLVTIRSLDNLTGYLRIWRGKAVVCNSPAHLTCGVHAHLKGIINKAFFFHFGGKFYSKRCMYQHHSQEVGYFWPIKLVDCLRSAMQILQSFFSWTLILIAVIGTVCSLKENFHVCLFFSLPDSSIIFPFFLLLRSLPHMGIEQFISFL